MNYLRPASRPPEPFNILKTPFCLHNTQPPPTKSNHLVSSSYRIAYTTQQILALLRHGIAFTHNAKSMSRTHRSFFSPRGDGEGRIPRATHSFSTGQSMDIRDIPQNLHIAAGGALVLVALHCKPLVNPQADATCAICLEDHSTSHSLVKLRVCAHPFHVECLDEWVSSTTNNATGCPVCWKPIVRKGHQLFSEDINGTWVPVHCVGHTVESGT
jgi:hypothetical protein